MTHKSRPDYDNQELGTTKAHKGAQRKDTKEITREPWVRAGKDFRRQRRGDSESGSSFPGGTFRQGYRYYYGQ
jgi:hypothetical protein